MAAPIIEQERTTKAPGSLTYTPALDGLRAFAVIAVMLYHGGVAWLPGGFLGVDLFFVLSGFLITSLLILEFDRSDNVSLVSFWKRRARRLYPALVLMVFGITIYVLTLAPLDTLRSLRADGIATMAYVSNWWFALTGRSYFVQFSTPSLFQHTWSLGIEEQFYWLWPVLIGFGFKRLGTHRNKWIPLLLGGAALSAMWMAFLYKDGADPSRVYFGTDTRAQSLLLGAALAFIGLYLRQRQIKADWLGALGIAGFLAWVAFTLFVTDHDGWMYRGGFAAVAVVCAAAILSVSTDQDSPLAMGLRLRPFVYVGLISYGLYLWHWPIFIILDGERTGLSGYPLLGVRFGVTFLVAIGTYHFLEIPIRHGLLKKPEFLRGAVAAAVLVGVLFIAATTFLAAPADSITASATGGRRVLIVGDSQAAAALNYRKGFVSVAGVPSMDGIDLYNGGQIGCGLLRGIPKNIAGPPEIKSGGCINWDERWSNAVDAADPELSIMLLGVHERLDQEVDGKFLKVGTPEWAAYLTAQLDLGVKALTKNGRKVVLLSAPCIHDMNKSGNTPRPEYDDPARQKAVNDVFSQYAKAHPKQVVWADLDAYLCADGYKEQFNGVTMRVDGLHFSGPGSRIFWSWLAPIIDKALPAAPKR